MASKFFLYYIPKGSDSVEMGVYIIEMMLLPYVTMN